MTHPLAGQPAPTASLADIPALLAAYRNPPDPPAPAQRGALGTTAPRGRAPPARFTESHILATTPPAA